MRLRGTRVLTQQDICDPQPEPTTVGLSKWAVDIRELVFWPIFRAFACTSDALCANADAEKRVAAQVNGSWRVVNAGGRDAGRDRAPFCHCGLTEIPYEALIPRR